MKYGISDKSYALMLNTFSQDNTIKSVTLFGSRAMGNHKQGSDIDLSVRFDAIKNNKLATKLNQELPMPYYFDVLDYDVLENTTLKTHINDFGKVIYKSNKQ